MDPYNSGLVQIMERGQPWNNCEVRISIFFLVSVYVRDVGNGQLVRGIG